MGHLWTIALNVKIYSLFTVYKRPGSTLSGLFIDHLALVACELIPFKFHSCNDYIVSGGVFSHTPNMQLSMAWDTFGAKNGVVSAAASPIIAAKSLHEGITPFGVGRDGRECEGFRPLAYESLQCRNLRAARAGHG